MEKLYVRKKIGKDAAVYEYYFALIFLFENNIHEADKWFEKAVANSNNENKGDLYQKIAYWRGLMHLREEADLGITEKEALVKAKEYFEDAANGGLAEAQYQAGVMYRDGLGGEKDPREAERWFLRAAEQGYFRAAYELGLMYFRGQGEISCDYQEAKKWFEEQAMPLWEGRLNKRRNRPVDISARCFSKLGYIGNIYVNATCGTADIYREGIHTMFNLAAIYLRGGDGVERKSEKAKEWLDKAIKWGSRDIDSQIIEELKTNVVRSEGIAMILRIVKETDNRVVHEDTGKLIGTYGQEGIEWILDSIAEAKHDNLREVARNLLRQHIDPISFVHFLLHRHRDLRRLVAPHVDEKVGRDAAVYQYWYALSFLFGNDIRNADEWFHKAEELFREAASNSEDDYKRDFLTKISFWRGCMYVQDDVGPIFGITREMALVKARKYFEDAANRGLAEAQYQAGVMYRDGTGGEKGPRNAEKWFRRAVEQGYFRAAYELGLMYFRGQGEISRNYKEAKKWFEEMVKPNNKIGISDLDKLGRRVAKRQSHGIDHDLVVDQRRIRALFYLAFIYHYGGNNVEQDYNKGEEYFKKAAGMVDKSYHGRARLWNEAIEGLGLFLETARVYEPLMELFMQRVFKNPVNSKMEDMGAFEWLVSVAETGNDEEKESTGKVLIRYFHFMEENFEENTELEDVYRQMNTQRIELLLSIAKAGDDETRSKVRKLLARHIDSMEKFVLHRIWDWLDNPEGAHDQQNRLRALIRPHVDENIGREAAVYQYYYALSFLFSGDDIVAKKWFDRALKWFDRALLTRSRKDENGIKLRQKIEYWLGHICLRNDEIQEADVNARKYFEDAGSKIKTDANPDDKVTSHCGESGQMTGSDSHAGAAPASGLAEAQYEAGLMYRDGSGGAKKEPGKAGELFKRAAKQDLSRAVCRRAAYQFGRMHFYGQVEVLRNYRTAEKWFIKALPEEQVAKYDDTPPKSDLAELGCIYKAGAWEFDRRNLMIFKDAVWREQADALAHLGFIYLHGGYGVAQCPSKAKGYFEKAAEACHADAMFNLGLISLKNDDRTKAIEWFEKAWEGDLDCDECGPKGRYEHIKERDLTIYKEESELYKRCQENGPGTVHLFRRNMKEKEKLYSCSLEYWRILKSRDWWPRYRGNWLALHHLAILYQDRRGDGDEEKAKRCREKLEMTGFTMPEYSKRT